MEFKGTGGDWYVLGDEYPSIQSKSNHPRATHTLPTIAQVNSTFINKGEYKANAQLIAHAPKLLEMLQKIVLVTDTCKGDFNDFKERYNAEIKDLIKQATTI